jgi:hypothetical protein
LVFGLDVLNLHLFDNLLRILTMADVVLIFRQ